METFTKLKTMNCSKYMDLSVKERIEFIGRLIHSVQSDDKLFAEGQKIIHRAETLGIFHGVTILPQMTEGDANPDLN